MAAGTILLILLGLFVAGAILVLSGFYPLQALGAAAIWVVGMLVLLGLVVLVALGLRALIFRRRGGGRGRRVT